MEEGVRPIVVFSRCLGFDACRYNGGIVREPAVEGLKPFVDVRTVCPEVAIGLGVPRAPIRWIGRDELRVVQPESGRDVTEEMAAFTDSFLGELEPVDGFILKWGSPSCGPREVKAYVSAQRGAAFTKTAGAFGGAVVNRFPLRAIEDEGRLKNFDIRQHFLTQLFALARFRRAEEEGAIRDLVAFHTRHKLLLMAYHQSELRTLGRIVANGDRRRPSDVFSAYREHLSAALSRPPRRTSAINVLMHALGYVSDRLTAREKAFFLDSLTQYRSRRVPLAVPTELIRSWIVRFETAYLADQVFFAPFPGELVETLDSGKGRPLR